ncbi:MAG TPA: hypothetical protein VMG37_08820 [Solirubrobacteraceae bacterium]|nr:hypothetical protein [Solirubrobacteraceae bacterium]
MRTGVRNMIAAVAITAFAVLGIGAAASAAAQVPVLAGPWAPGQKGYGHVKPGTIFNGGDPTGLVKAIHWRSWGGHRATGTGTALWVGPHQFVAQGRFEKGASIVLFQLGRCSGRLAYNAIEWYFPQHGQKFSAGTYINACTGTYYMDGHPEP